MDHTLRLDGRHILTVDDSLAVRLFVRERLAEIGAEVEEAETGAAVERLLAAGRRFDVVVLDLVLPDTDGLSVLARLRERDEDAAVVMLSSATAADAATAAVRAGADGFVDKQRLVGATGDAEFLGAVAAALDHRAALAARRQLDRLRGDFYATITHDLRNPAGNVLASLKLLRSGRLGPLAPRQEEVVDVAMRAAEKLVAIASDYLDLAAIEAGRTPLDRRPDDLAALVRRCVAECRDAAEAAGVRLRAVLPTAPLPARIDARKMEQAVDNLLSNAVKYTPAGGRVLVRLERDAADARVAVLEVRDTGMGIPREQQERVFSKFGRTTGARRSAIGGTGLGLAIVKEIVVAHEGEITVRSEGVPSLGSVFIVRLPVADA